jgi:hypothetical protein
MKKVKITLVSLIILIFLHENLEGQQYKYKKVSVELLEKKECDIQLDAPAMVTNKTGLREIVYSESSGFTAILSQQTQVKFFKGDAKDIGTVEIYYYSPKSSSNKVKMSDIKGKTYNLENKKIVETKLSDDNIFHVQFNNYYKKATFVFPNIKDGCVFEYEYVLTSDYFANIEDWFIQDEIPVLYNQFTLKIPEYFRYQINILGGFAPTSDEISSSSRSINYKVVYEGQGFKGRQVEHETFNMNYSNRTLIHENLPSFIPEPFTANQYDGKSKITHQLISVAFPNSPTQTFAGTYEKINSELLEDESFGEIISDGKFIEKLVSFSGTETSIEKANLIHQYFLKNVKFDGSNYYLSDKGGSKLFKEGTGNSGEINLNYIAALNHVGIPTSPVILSSRGNGTLHPVLPDYSQFDYVVALSIINDKEVFSDAASTLPFGNLPKKCLHDKGWVVSKTNARWVNLKQNCSGKQIIQTDIIQTKEQILYSSKINKFNYFAYDDLDAINANSELDFLRTFHQEKDLIQDSIFITEKTDKVLKLKEHHNQAVVDDDFIYVKPFIHLPFDSNPFKQEERQTYVDFPYGMEYKFVSNIKILDGYNYEVPANLNAVMQENDLILKYSSSYIAGIKTLTVIADFKIIQTEFSPLDYEKLKFSLDTMINKLNEPVILKKI